MGPTWAEYPWDDPSYDVYGDAVADIVEEALWVGPVVYGFEPTPQQLTMLVRARLDFGLEYLGHVATQDEADQVGKLFVGSGYVVDPERELLILAEGLVKRTYSMDFTPLTPRESTQLKRWEGRQLVFVGIIGIGGPNFKINY
jgi:hypothetical protein